MTSTSGNALASTSGHARTKTKKKYAHVEKTLAVDSPEWNMIKEILSWDFLHLLRADSGKRKARENRLPFEKRLREVPIDFDGIGGFEDVFEPLALEEARAQMKQGWSDASFLLFEGRVASVGKLLEKDSTFIEAEIKIVGDNLCKGREITEVKEDLKYGSFMDKDVILLTRDDPNAPESQAHRKAYLLAYLERFERQDSSDKGGEQDRTLKLIVLARGHKKQSVVEPSKSEALLDELRSSVGAEDERWWISRISNLSTLLRENNAIFGVRGSAFESFVLDPTGKRKGGNKKVPAYLVIPDALGGGLQEEYNDLQFKSLVSSLDRDKAMLIQGPPGTGKTRVLLGLLSVLCNSNMFPLSNAITSLCVGDRNQAPPSKEERRRKHLVASPWLRSAKDRTPQKNKEKFLFVPKNPVVEIKETAKSPPKILICTPSNSALDEIVFRVKERLLMDDIGMQYRPEMARVGVRTSINPEVREFSSFYRADAKVKEEAPVGGKGMSTDAYMKAVRAEERRLLQKSQLIFSTLAYSGKLFETEMGESLKFDYIIVDEAAQCVEPTCLIPLTRFACKKFFLIGDPVQLPATVISQTAVKLQYNRSLFQRFQLSNYPVQMLREQYRMHPEISMFPSRKFYGGKLLDGPGLAESLEREWHKYDGFRPYTFFDVQGASMRTQYDSFENETQADFAVAYIEALLEKFPDINTSSIGIIATYKPQIDKLKVKVNQKFGEEVGETIEVLSVDAYQGREKDVILWTTVRGDPGAPGAPKSIGFLRDERRMNVGLTRAKSTLVVIGSRITLESDPNWRDLMDSTKRRGLLHKLKAPFDFALKEMLRDNPDRPDAKMPRTDDGASPARPGRRR